MNYVKARRELSDIVLKTKIVDIASHSNKKEIAHKGPCNKAKEGGWLH